MKQLSKTRSFIYHLYPGILITLGFIMLAPLSISYGYPPQFGMLLCIILIAIPVLTLHLLMAKKAEGAKTIGALNGFNNRLSLIRLILYALGLVVVAFIIWGITQQPIFI